MLAESNLRLVVSIAKHNTRIDYIGHIAAYYDALKENNVLFLTVDTFQHIFVYHIKKVKL